MEDIYQDQQALQSELLPGETLLWSGKPSRRVIFHKEDAGAIPFSLMFGAFAVFWELGVTGGLGSRSNSGHLDWFMALWGIPFVVVGQYLIWGRFFYAAWKKGRILYGLTQKRLLILDTVWKRSLQSTYIDQIPVIDKSVRADGIGTLRFGHLPLQTGRRGMSGFDSLNTYGVPVFVDIENAEAVYAQVAELRQKAKSGSRES